MQHTVTISKLKHYPALSEETYCFTCDVLLDGKKTWEAKNNGQGEMSRLYYIKPTTTRGEHDSNAIIELVEKFVHEAIMEKAKSKDLKAVAKKLSTSLFFRIDGQKEGAYYHVKTPTPNDPDTRKRIFKDAKIDVIINDLPISEAVKYFYKYE